MPDSIDRVLSSALNGRPSPVWSNARARLATERQRIDEFLESPDSPPVYGFTTLLGHRDTHQAAASQQNALLTAHLQGAPFERPAQWVRLVTAAKIEQLHHGGSGLHPDVYSDLLASLQYQRKPATGDWGASYGSGDVVPAAWWLNSLFTSGALDRATSWKYSGTLISLINGHSLATAELLAATAGVADEAAHLLVRLSEVAQPGVKPVGQLQTWFTEATRAGRPRISQIPQLPVSLRDATPIMEACKDVVGQALDAVEFRLSKFSGNPLFTESRGKIGVHSQNSFLDFTGSFSATGLAQLCSLLSGLWQRIINYQKRRAEVEVLQPPKVARAMIEKLSLGSPPLIFVGDDSEGIEDLRDRTLHTLELVRRGLTVLTTLREMAEPLSAGTHVERRPPVQTNGPALRALLADVGRHHLADSFPLVRHIYGPGELVPPAR